MKTAAKKIMNSAAPHLENEQVVLFEQGEETIKLSDAIVFTVDSPTAPGSIYHNTQTWVDFAPECLMLCSPGPDTRDAEDLEDVMINVVHEHILCFTADEVVLVAGDEFMGDSILKVITHWNYEEATLFASYWLHSKILWLLEKDESKLLFESIKEVEQTIKQTVAYG
jgi:hypothetical protein